MPRTRIIGLLVALFACRICGAAAPDEPIVVAVEVDFGQDRGQSLGSLFEARDADGQIVAGAGFHDVYNTHFRTDRRVLQAFVRPDKATAPVIERLPDPGLGSGAYLFDFHGELFAWSSVAGGSTRRWDPEAKAWLDETPAGVSSIRKGDVVQRIGSGVLACCEGQARYDGSLVLAAPEVGAYSDFYYANGLLCFYHRRRSETDGFTHIYACPWTPTDGRIDLSRAVVLDTMYDFETTFGWGQWNDQVLTVSNVGGVYVFADGAWRVALDPDRNVSYQVYSMLRRRDRLLLAQYPTGHVFDYRGETAVEIPDWPPRIPGVAPSARECQTLAVYNGQLFAGVWPWAELWRLDDDDRWHSHGRMFTHPEITNETQHPYEADAKRMQLVLNHWGQRISGMVPVGNSLYVSTSTKGMGRWPDKVDFLTDEQRREYGAVIRLRMPGNLATPIQWPRGKTKLEFVIGPGSLAVRQDGAELAAIELTAGRELDAEQLQFSGGEGIHGPLRGEVLRHSIEAN